MPETRDPIAGVKVSAREFQVLAALVEAHKRDGEFCYLSFRAIAAESNLDIKHVRRTVRSLAYKGLTQYARGLVTDAGEMAGAGYACTPAGLDLHTRLADQAEPS